MTADSNTVAEFRFSQPSYNVSEDSGVVSVCLELVNGTLTEDVVIKIELRANGTTAFSESVVCVY